MEHMYFIIAGIALALVSTAYVVMRFKGLSDEQQKEKKN